MSLNKALLAELGQEMAQTRKTLERLPEQHWAWKPHEKSWTVGELASHTANIPKWGVLAFETEEFDYAPPGQEPPKNELIASSAELLQQFDENVEKFRAAVAAATDEAFGTEWSLLGGGQKVLTMPRAMVVRSMIMNHLIHHRGQITVYMRLLNIPVPALYGASADEGRS
jgi:uncharacterized damage-inducible protein DinB